MLRVDEQERQSTEVSAMQVRKYDAVEVIGIEAARFERDQRRCPTIDQYCRLRGFHAETSVEPTAGAEGVTRSENSEPHAQLNVLGRLILPLMRRLRPKMVVDEHGLPIPTNNFRSSEQSSSLVRVIIAASTIL